MSWEVDKDSVNNNYQGITDEAAVKDEFGIEKYTKALSDFIKHCDTPMTVSIQGSWGTGKTSFINLVEKELVKEQCVLFNTWQYSQFNMDDNLSIALLTRLVRELMPHGENIQENEKNTSKKIKKVVKTIARFGLVFAAGRLGGEPMGNLAADITSSNSEDSQIEEFDISQAVSELKDEFQELIKERISEINRDSDEKVDRIVIFVDDLDRLAPRKAVELLEVLKLFLDCKNCVFVLAIDYDVVCLGVAQKYDLDYKNEKEKEKGKSFFDKIIQVPFKMPVGEYQIKQYAEMCIKQLRIKYTDDELDVFVDLLSDSIGTNPRSMKRIFNSYLLLTKVTSEKEIDDKSEREMLFAILCLQHSKYEKVYNYIVSNRETINEKQLAILKGKDYETNKEFYDDMDLSPEEVEGVQPLMEDLYNIIDTDKNDGISYEEFDKFKLLLGVSTSVSASGDDGNRPKYHTAQEVGLNEFKLEYLQPEKITSFLSRIKDKFPEISWHFINRKTDSFINGIWKDNVRQVCSLNERSKGFLVQMYPKSKKRLLNVHDPIVREVFDRRQIKQTSDSLYGYQLYVHFDNESEWNDMIVLMEKACSTWG